MLPGQVPCRTPSMTTSTPLPPAGRESRNAPMSRLPIIAASFTLIAILGAFAYLEVRSFAIHPDVIDRRESVYNDIYVIRQGPMVVMTFGHNRDLFTETEYDTRDELALPSPYSRYMTAALAYAGNTDRFLEIGFGGGRTTWYLHRSVPAMDITSVELDPEVFELAKLHFGVRPEPGFRVEIDDGRRWLQRRDGQTWPVIAIDAYRGPSVPFHLLTKEFYELVKARLAPAGAAVQNVAPSTMMFDAAVATMASVFDHLDLYEADGNIVMVGYEGPRRSFEALLASARRLDAAHGFRYPLAEMVREARPLKQLPDTRPLTDDFAPVELLRATERHNRGLEPMAPPEPRQ